MLHRYYKKQSTFLHGVEGEVSQAFVGQQAINDKIETLGFKDCVVCLSTVDSVESIDNSIVIQVLGELSNNAAPSQKFAQTFVLAYVPPTGYFVLNDIFRYLKEDTESEFDDTGAESASEMETPGAHDHVHSDRLSNGFHPATHPIDSDDRPPSPISLPALSVPTNPMPETSVGPEQQDLPTDRHESRASIGAKENQSSIETPQTNPLQAMRLDAHSDEPESSNADKSGPLETEHDTSNDIPTVPIFDSPVIKTWASLAATNREKWSAQVEQRTMTSGTGTHSRTDGHPTVARKEMPKFLHQGDKQEPALGYIKHVGSKVQKNVLNDALIKFGPLKDLDINRQKSCGFVEFVTHSALQAAIAAGPIDLGENIKVVVEERRKSGKAGVGKQSATDRKANPKSDEGRGPGSKKPARQTVGVGSQKPRTD